MDKDFLWKLYEHQAAALFKSIPGAEVHENVRETGVDSGQERQIDVLVKMPLEALLPGGFRVSVPVKIVVDCKHYSRPVDLPRLGAIEVLKNDVRANLAIVVSPMGVSEGAEAYAENHNIVPLRLGPDLLARIFGEDRDVSCQICEQYGNEMYWRDPVFSDVPPLDGRCAACGALHLCCPDCFSVIGVQDGEPLACPSPCKAVFELGFDRDTMEYSLRRCYDSMEAVLLRKLAARKTKRLAANEVDAIIRATRWQFWTDNPLVGLTEDDLVEWNDDGTFLSLTPHGDNVATSIILEATEPEWFYTSSLIWLKGLDENGRETFGRIASSDLRFVPTSERRSPATPNNHNHNHDHEAPED